MTIQFPRDLAVSNLVEIQITDFVKRLLGGPFTVDQVKMPVDGIAVFQIFVTKKIKLMAANLIGLVNDLFRLLRNPLTKEFKNGRNGCRREEKPARPGICRLNQALRKIDPETRENCVATLSHFLPAAIH